MRLCSCAAYNIVPMTDGVPAAHADRHAYRSAGVRICTVLPKPGGLCPTARAVCSPHQAVCAQLCIRQSQTHSRSRKGLPILSVVSTSHVPSNGGGVNDDGRLIVFS